MDSIEEVRYPWGNIAEFWLNGYWQELGALHLLFGSLFIAWTALRTYRDNTLPLEFRLSSIYFSLTVYTNPAFNFGGLNTNEIFGIAAVFVIVFKGKLPSVLHLSAATVGLILLFAVSVCHNLLVSILYPELIPTIGVGFTKLAINLKIIVLAGNLAIVGASISRGVGTEKLIKRCIEAGIVAQILYLLQMAIALTGTLPYGTFLDAGFIGIPSFGSVSIERGHMGKFIAPYFAFFLFALIYWKRYWAFTFFVVVSAINFSASGQVFLLCSLLISAAVFRKHFGVSAYCLGVLLATFMAWVVFNYWFVFDALIQKILTIAIQGDESQGGGRSIGLFIEYLNAFPFGIGYSGSTLRTAPNLPEINAAHFAFVTQYSLFAAPIMIVLLFILIKAFTAGLHGGTLARCMAVGAAMAGIIFFVDILWFVPLVWLPIEIILSTQHRRLSLRQTLLNGNSI